MAEQILTKEQKKVVAEVDKRLTKAGLPTYTEMEEHLFAALTAAMDGVNMGKQLMVELKRRSEELVVKLEARDMATKTAQKEVSDGSDC